jgi:hypothetical protein
MAIVECATMFLGARSSAEGAAAAACVEGAARPSPVADGIP